MTVDKLLENCGAKCELEKGKGRSTAFPPKKEKIELTMAKNSHAETRRAEEVGHRAAEWQGAGYGELLRRPLGLEILGGESVRL